MLLKWVRSREWEEFERAWLNWTLFGDKQPAFPHAPRMILIPDIGPETRQPHIGADLFTD